VDANSYVARVDALVAEKRLGEALALAREAHEKFPDSFAVDTVLGYVTEIYEVTTGFKASSGPAEQVAAAVGGFGDRAFTLELWDGHYGPLHMKFHRVKGTRVEGERIAIDFAGGEVLTLEGLRGMRWGHSGNLILRARKATFATKDGERSSPGEEAVVELVLG
jgi:hypothetical protein